MHSSVRKDIQSVLDAAYGNIKSENYSELHGLSDHIIHSISIYQEKEISDCAVAIYALDKIFQKEKYLKHKDFPAFRKQVLSDLDSARRAIAKDKIPSYSNAVKSMLAQIASFDKKVGLFEHPLLEYAKTQKASKLVEHGLSVSQASKFMNVPEWDLSQRVGRTTAAELHHAMPVDNRKRVELTKKLFKVK